MHLQGRFQNVAVARLDEDGKLTIMYSQSGIRGRVLWHRFAIGRSEEKLGYFKDK